MTERTWTDDDVRDLVERTTATSGVPHKITDPVVLGRVAELFAHHGGHRKAAS